MKQQLYIYTCNVGDTFGPNGSTSFEIYYCQQIGNSCIFSVETGEKRFTVAVRTKEGEEPRVVWNTALESDNLSKEAEKIILQFVKTAIM